MTERDRKKRVPGPSSRWELFYYDTFDSERPCFLVEGGTGALSGLCALWSGVLYNGIMDDGRATFSSYELRFGESALERVAINVAPFGNDGLVKLRRWAEDLEGEENAGAAAGKRCGLTGKLFARVFKYAGSEEAGAAATGLNPLVRRVAAIHLLLLERSERWVSDLVDVSGEARELLDRVESMNDPGQLQSDLEMAL